MSQKQKTSLAIALLSLGILFFQDCPWLIEAAYAQGANTSPLNGAITAITTGGAAIGTILQFLAMIAFYFLQYLLDPLFIMGITESGNIGENQLNQIWMFSRDIVNIIFAFLLIFAGIITVVTHSSEYVMNYWKKFIFAVILVNFSWFFPRVILDVANVLTATVYQLPSHLESQCWYYENGIRSPCKVITDIKLNNQCSEAPGNGYKNLIPGVICYKEMQLAANANTALGMLNGLVVNYGRLTEYNRVIKPSNNPGAGANSGNQFGNLMFFLMHVVFIMVFSIMLTLPLIAMVIVFIIRIPIIWLTIAFMPFMFLGVVIGDKMGPFSTKLIFDEFIKAAFLPTIVAVPLTVGFILLNAMYGSAPPDVAAKLGENSGALIYGVNTFWQLMWLVMSVMVIWIGFFGSITKLGGFYASAVAGIQQFGNSIGQSAIKIPLALPIIPVGKGGMSILGAKNAAQTFNAGLSGGKSPLDSLRNATGTPTGTNANKSLGEAMNDSNNVTNKLLSKILGETAAGRGNKLNTNADVKNAIDDTANGGKVLQDIRIQLKAEGIKDADTITSQQIADLITPKINNDGKLK
ncbi:hypothetical protein FJZ28_00565 [Candidatus Peregrinibacteria bacterium]|nr:hypothetical protein [Candidatus Peregrinibacteria bacterium]